MLGERVPSNIRSGSDPEVTHGGGEVRFGRDSEISA